MLALAGLLWAGSSQAASPVEEAEMAELEKLRAQVADQVHLAAYDLIDELVFGLAEDPVFDKPTSVVLAGATVPLGLGTGMEALLENHITSVITQNPRTNLQLVHCPTCTAVVVHSGPEGTVVSRGVDNPQVLEDLGTLTGQHALFVDIEAEGTWLVLRARLTRLTPDLPIVWSRTLATSASTPALLREADGLKSAKDARQEYLDIISGRGNLTIPLRFVVRQYARPDISFEGGGLAAPPFIWLQTGVELGATRAKAWTSSLLGGYSYIPQGYQGLMAQARVSRLVTGRARSLTRPDLYVFLGGATMLLWGPATAPFQEEPVDADAVAAALNGTAPRTSLGAIHLGLDLRVGNRIGGSVFLETMPALATSENLGSYVRVGSINFQSLGTEVTFCF